MRPALLTLSLLMLTSAPAAAVPVGEVAPLEQAWHGCVREAFAAHSMSQGKLAAERSALDACKKHEDAYVAAILAAEVGEADAEGHAVPVGSKAWAALVSAYVFDPITAWLKAWRR